MSKYFKSSVAMCMALAITTFSSNTLAASNIVADKSDVTIPLFSETDKSIKQCLSLAKTPDAKIDCSAMAQENLNNLAESNYSAALKACDTYYDPNACHLSVKRAHDAYLYYYDEMRVVFTTLNPNANDKGIAQTEELILSITAMHARLLEEAIKTSQHKVDNVTIK